MKTTVKGGGALGKDWIPLTYACMVPLANPLGLLYSYPHFTDGESEVQIGTELADGGRW